MSGPSTLLITSGFGIIRTRGAGLTTMTDMAGLSTNLGMIAGRVRRGGERLKNRCAFAILTSVVMRTPVGNKNVWLEPKKAYIGYVGGRARANWFVGVSSANLAVTNAIDAGGTGPIMVGKTLIDGSGPAPIHLNNNLPYIIPLNEGWSSQAPAGFIDMAILDGLSAIRGLQITREDIP